MFSGVREVLETAQTTVLLDNPAIGFSAEMSGAFHQKSAFGHIITRAAIWAFSVHGEQEKAKLRPTERKQGGPVLAI